MPAAVVVTASTSVCKNWCRSHVQNWAVKCTWSKTCDGCSECSGVYKDNSLGTTHAIVCFVCLAYMCDTCIHRYYQGACCNVSKLVREQCPRLGDEMRLERLCGVLAMFGHACQLRYPGYFRIDPVMLAIATEIVL